MQRLSDSLIGNFSAAEHLQHKVQQRFFGAADGDAELSVFVAVFACKRDRAFAVNQPGNVSGIGWRKYIDRFSHSGLLVPKNPPAGAGGCDWWRRRDS